MKTFFEGLAELQEEQRTCLNSEFGSLIPIARIDGT